MYAFVGVYGGVGKKGIRIRQRLGSCYTHITSIQWNENLDLTFITSFVDIIHVVTALARPITSSSSPSHQTIHFPFTSSLPARYLNLSLGLNTCARNTPLKRLLANQPEPTHKHKQRQATQHNRQRNKRTNNTTNSR
jgi:hypothetical protein